MEQTYTPLVTEDTISEASDQYSKAHDDYYTSGGQGYYVGAKTTRDQYEADRKQTHAEIATLRAQVALSALATLEQQGPVAYMTPTAEPMLFFDKDEALTYTNEAEGLTPLYTHPTRPLEQQEGGVTAIERTVEHDDRIGGIMEVIQDVNMGLEDDDAWDIAAAVDAHVFAHPPTPMFGAMDIALAFNDITAHVKCPHCDDGEVGPETCRYCDGHGSIEPDMHTIKDRVRSFVRDYDHPAKDRRIAELAQQRDEAVKHLRNLTEHWAVEDGAIYPFHNDVNDAASFLCTLNTTTP